MTPTETQKVAALIQAARDARHHLLYVDDSALGKTIVGDMDKAVKEVEAVLRENKSSFNEYFLDQDEFSRYIADEVNPARSAEDLEQISDNVARAIYRVIVNKDYKK